MNTKIYKMIADKGVITENQVRLMRRRANEGYNICSIFENGFLKITDEQTSKGLSWLLNLYKTPTGRIRKNNPFNHTEASILKGFDRFELISFRDCGPWYVSSYYPVYRVYAKNGKYFDYIAKWNNTKNRLTTFKDALSN